MRGIERVLRRGASTPHTEHEKENIEGYMLEINQIFGAISKNGVFLTAPLLILCKNRLLPNQFFFLNFKHHSLWTSGQTRVHPA